MCQLWWVYFVSIWYHLVLSPIPEGCVYIKKGDMQSVNKMAYEGTVRLAPFCVQGCVHPLHGEERPYFYTTIPCRARSFPEPGGNCYLDPIFFTTKSCWLDTSTD